MYGLILGLCVGGGVVIVSSIRYGLSVPLLILGLVLLVVFGALGLMSAVVARRTRVE
ncbi:MAG TPA: hypothetical protein VI172_13130 [Candidatus Dormibacteraeota bacterium]